MFAFHLPTARVGRPARSECATLRPGIRLRLPVGRGRLGSRGALSLTLTRKQPNRYRYTHGSRSGAFPEASQ